MPHAEAGGKSTGIFEYTLGAKEDEPLQVDGQLVMQIIEEIYQLNYIEKATLYLLSKGLRLNPDLYSISYTGNDSPALL